MTTAAGVPVADNQKQPHRRPTRPGADGDYTDGKDGALQPRARAGTRGGTPMGAGAYGKFTVTGDISKYTCAQDFFQGRQQL